MGENEEKPVKKEVELMASRQHGWQQTVNGVTYCRNRNLSI